MDLIKPLKVSVGRISSLHGRSWLLGSDSRGHIQESAVTHRWGGLRWSREHTGLLGWMWMTLPNPSGGQGQTAPSLLKNTRVQPQDSMAEAAPLNHLGQQQLLRDSLEGPSGHSLLPNPPYSRDATCTSGRRLVWEKTEASLAAQDGLLAGHSERYLCTSLQATTLLRA